MVDINPQNQSAKENYKLLIGSVLPRPIAFITTLGQNNIVNAAPFSFYNVVCPDPPMLGISCSRLEGGRMKDTIRNAKENGTFVVHVVDHENLKQVNECSINYPPDQSEVNYAGLTLTKSFSVDTPSIKEAKISMECKVKQIIPLGGTQDTPSNDFLIGEIVHFKVDDSIYYDGKIDTEKLQPIGRLAGTNYSYLGDIVSMSRPTYGQN
ncbi:flavin reductase family protein [Scopulibacillus cellulosilyticus]|uniref:Flavin reductase family protein n=1 Tax=Scopulibacillus cellulosilyticus TaxID=2665665 RepID=A0ABW2Q1M4_9BACL